ncbi:MAG TPA: HAD family phosphatase [Chitinophagales bacterium]|nr:HAD family phosphatase [Chitinophagales bacterium]
MTKIKAIVFDLGKVIFDLSYEQVIAYWAEKANKDYQELLDGFVYNDIFEQYERGELSDAAFRDAVRTIYHLPITDEEFDSGWNNIYLDIFDGINNLLRDLSAQYHVVALSNTNHIHKLVWEVRYADTLQYFEKIFASHEMGCRKPEPQCFHMVLDYLNLAPEATVFVDDHPANIEAANRIGLHTVLVTSFPQMQHDLMQILNKQENTIVE